MQINVTKKDVIWSYTAQFFNLATGLITLPLILKLLSADEVGFNYILISINSMVALFDLGFSGQFSRYLTYIYSGAQKIQKEGISTEYSDVINDHLLACTIKTAKSIYLIISLVASMFLVTLGTYYVYDITEGFSLIENVLIIWSIFCLSSLFNIYFLYYNSFLQGRGYIKETKQGQVYSKISQIIITFTMLFCGFGLLSVVVANLIAPFVFRCYAHKIFYTKDLKIIIAKNHIVVKEIREVFSILWYNAKKMGIIGILSSAIGYASTLVIGSYLSLSEVGSYGLLVQLTGIVFGVSTIHFYSIMPTLSSLMVKKDYSEVRQHFGISMFFFYSISLIGMLVIFFAIPVWKWCGFNTQLPSFLIVVCYYIYKFVEQNQSLFSQLFMIENDMRFYHSAVLTGIFSFVLLWIALYMGYGLAGMVLLQSIPLFIYSAWRWPIDAIKTYNINIYQDFFNNPYIKTHIYERYFCFKR